MFFLYESFLNFSFLVFKNMKAISRPKFCSPFGLLTPNFFHHRSRPSVKKLQMKLMQNCSKFLGKRKTMQNFLENASPFFIEILRRKIRRQREVLLLVLNRKCLNLNKFLRICYIIMPIYYIFTLCNKFITKIKIGD